MARNSQAGPQVLEIIPTKRQLSWFWRAYLIGVGSLLVIMLGLAVWLEPSPRGLGTHQQLGLPPCTMIQLYGVICPSCGMTTAWSHTVRGELLAGLQANAGGVALAVQAMIAAPWALISGFGGRLLTPAPRDGQLIAVAAIDLVIILAQYLWRLNG